MVITGEFGNGLDVLAGAGEAVEDDVEVSTLLHRDNAELIFFVNPHEEGLVVVVENTSAFGPFAVKTACL